MATDVDHIIPRRLGGADDISNLQLLCHECHSRKTMRELNQDRKPKDNDTNVVIVHGPPGAGKTTFVLEHMRPDDLVVDWDLLAQALAGGAEMYYRPAGHIPFVAAARDAIYERLKRSSEVGQAWIVTASANQRDVQRLVLELDAELITLDPGIAQVMENLRNDPRRSVDDWAGIVKRWYEQAEVSTW